MSFWFVIWLLALGLPILTPDKVRPLAKWALPASALGLVFAVQLTQEMRIVICSVFFLYVMKASVMLTYSRESIRRIPLQALLLHFTLWPGMDAAAFIHARPNDLAKLDPDIGKRFTRGLLFVYAGLTTVLLLAVFRNHLLPQVLGIAGLLALLVVVHFGVSDILTSLVRLAGWPVPALFEQPWKSRSLTEFWGLRWNRPFIEMDRKLFLRPCARLFGTRGAVFGVFLISGLLHELAISFPAQGGWGLPFAYFLLHGVLVYLERWLKLKGRLWTWFWVLAPFPLLFPETFRSTFILPLFSSLNAFLTSRPVSGHMDWLLWAVSIGQLLVLFASFQVPTKLRWREELPRLSPFNRKFVWTAGGFTILTIVGQALLTLLFHDRFIQGDPLALGVAAFMAIFWSTRLLVDGFYYASEDWPKGSAFVIGHALLNSLFAFLVLGYGGLLVYHGIT